MASGALFVKPLAWCGGGLDIPDEREDPPAVGRPAMPASPGKLLEAVVGLQRQLEPIVGALCRDGTAVPLLDALQAENVELRGEIERLKEEAATRHAATKAVVSVSIGTDTEMHAVDLADVDFLVEGALALAKSPVIAHPERKELKAMRVDSRSEYQCQLQQEAPTGFNDGMHSISRERGTTNFSISSSPPMRVSAPKRAFVINTRRLIDAQETLVLFHELLSSTAIAALTLVNAGTVRQLASTCWFLSYTTPIFILHLSQWDMLDISDIATLMPLLSDDDEDLHGKVVANPNRLLKAVSFSSSLLGHYFRFFFNIIWFLVLAFMLLICSRDLKLTKFEEGDSIDEILNVFVATEEDMEVLNMQVFVGFLMFMVHCFFEFYYYHDTCSVMPRTVSNGIWDPRTDGLPWRFRVLGLPSMWFTSQDALEDLKHWIDLAVPTSRVVSIYPQEIAYYTLAGSEERVAVQSALKNSKLFDGRQREFVDRGELGGTETLNVELCFFDEALQNKLCPFPGEFLSVFGEPESQVQRGSLLPRGMVSLDKRQAFGAVASKMPGMGFLSSMATFRH